MIQKSFKTDASMLKMTILNLGKQSFENISIYTRYRAKKL